MTPWSYPNRSPPSEAKDLESVASPISTQEVAGARRGGGRPDAMARVVRERSRSRSDSPEARPLALPDLNEWHDETSIAGDGACHASALLTTCCRPFGVA
jgi:hypothetical protein